MKRRIRLIAFAAAVLLAWLFCVPRELFRGTQYSTVVESAEGELLGARVAADGQWRFPPCDTVPERFSSAIIQFEDRRFERHVGVDPVAIGRAFFSNLKAGHTVSGGSTITMQVMRLSHGGERNIWRKALEAVQATRLEARCSKNEILSLYASHAPFGGNVVGLEAASWRYFGRPARELSWAEAATLAVLPNSPSSIHPGRGREALLEKRNRLLERLLEHGDISPETYEAALGEPLPDKPHPLPALAVHYVEGRPAGERTRSTLRATVQKAVSAAVDRRSDEMAAEGVADMAVVVMDNLTGEVIAYVGNSSSARERPGRDVDIASSPRSTGSILKPFLYEAALREGTILPQTLLPDIPVNLGGFAPQNFDRQYYGAVPADEALARSLNVPAVFLLREFGIPQFHAQLCSLGLTTITKSPDHYGLSLILGGAEAKLTEIVAAYSAMSRRGTLEAWYTLDALKEVNRPDELDWRLIRSVRKAAWKTGTSYGFRDAWAVGMTPEYTIGVWAGNAEGQGVPGLTGARAAGPVMFDILALLPYSGAWWDMPSDYVLGKVCPSSGFLASADCPSAEDIPIPLKGLDSRPCPYHRGGSFSLPPAMEWYYKAYHPEYVTAAPLANEKVMEFIYPAPGSTLTIPRQLTGKVEGVVFRVAHKQPAATLWWHLDNTYVGETRMLHELRLAPSPGKHTLTVVDSTGATAHVSFTVAR